MPYLPTFRMKALPKSEYALLRSLIKYYNFNEPSELVTVLLRLAYQIHRSDLKPLLIGEIQQYRDNKSEERDYPLED